MKLLVDMNVSPRWVGFLNGARIRAVHWSAIGRSNAPDREILAYAVANGCVVLTHDLDFGAILAAIAGDGPSVVQIRAEDTSPDAIGAKVADAILQLKSELDAGALVTVDPARTRVRLLPLRRND